MPSCIKWGQERHQECSATEDKGYSECSEKADQGYNSCCTWAPCSWACRTLVWISNIVCVVWTWISNIVCVAWTWITTAVCVLWDTVVTIANAVLVTLESTLGWVFVGAGFLLELVEAIPYVGTIIKFILNFITTVVAVIMAIPDLVLGAIGIRPEKKLRVCTVVLRDETGNSVSSNAATRQLLQMACDIYKRDCNVRIIPLKPFKYTTGFADGETVDDDWIITDDNNATATILDVPCDSNISALGAPASEFQLKSSVLCIFGAWRRITGTGSPVTCFIIRSLPDAIGCQVTFTDYATIQGSLTLPHPSPRTLGHEVGHACMLGHRCVDDDNANMMGTQAECNPDSATLPDRNNPRINNIQALTIRASKHVTYF